MPSSDFLQLNTLTVKWLHREPHSLGRLSTAVTVPAECRHWIFLVTENWRAPRTQVRANLDLEIILDYFSFRRRLRGGAVAFLLTWFWFTLSWNLL